MLVTVPVVPTVMVAPAAVVVTLVIAPSRENVPVPKIVPTVPPVLTVHVPPLCVRAVIVPPESTVVPPPRFVTVPATLFTDKSKPYMLLIPMIWAIPATPMTMVTLGASTNILPTTPETVAIDAPVNVTLVTDAARANEPYPLTVPTISPLANCELPLAC